MHFTSYKETTWSPLDANSERSGPEQPVAVTISMSIKDSTITVTADGQKALVYKITTIYPEDEDKPAGDKITLIVCKDGEGKKCSARVVLHSYKSWHSLTASILYTATKIDYNCDYMKKITQ
jgi:ribosomal protein S1